jgi:hypothetical protein
MNGKGQLLLYLDFDGTLHHHEVWFNKTIGPYLRAPDEYRLFQHSELLAQFLEPYPAVKIILSTTWVQRFGRAKAAKQLLPSLRARVVGACSAEMRGFQEAPRGIKVWADVRRRKPLDWLALDDSDEGWLPEIRHHLVLAHKTEGLGEPSVQREFKFKLVGMCK